jgi:bifunctional DNA-binding transcriptional regulator/antitoxin component of YhaV-PrlF toxin-antitoxin module
MEEQLDMQSARRIGNSIAVIIPYKAREALGITERTKFDVKVDKEKKRLILDMQGGM